MHRWTIWDSRSRTWTRLAIVFLFKQKTAYEMSIGDWSSDVCSSDLPLSARSPTKTEAWSLPLRKASCFPSAVALKLSTENPDQSVSWRALPCGAPFLLSTLNSHKLSDSESRLPYFAN